PSATAAPIPPPPKQHPQSPATLPAAARADNIAISRAAPPPPTPPAANTPGAATPSADWLSTRRANNTHKPPHPASDSAGADDSHPTKRHKPTRHVPFPLIYVLTNLFSTAILNSLCRI